MSAPEVEETRTHIIEIQRIVDGPIPASMFPFYSDGCGNYCFRKEDNFDEAWLYDHETGKIVRESTGGFAGWFEVHFSGTDFTHEGSVYW